MTVPPFSVLSIHVLYIPGMLHFGCRSDNELAQPKEAVSEDSSLSPFGEIQQRLMSVFTSAERIDEVSEEEVGEVMKVCD